jgi:hypothetical protein
MYYIAFNRLRRNDNTNRNVQAYLNSQLEKHYEYETASLQNSY